MKAADVARAARETSTTNLILCGALQTVLPVLRALQASSGRWKFWLRWGMGVLIGALESFMDGACGLKGQDDA